MGRRPTQALKDWFNVTSDWGDAQALLLPGCLVIGSDRLECVDDQRKSFLPWASPRSSVRGTTLAHNKRRSVWECTWV